MSDETESPRGKPIRRSYVMATVILLVLVAYVASGSFGPEIRTLTDRTGLTTSESAKASSKATDGKAASEAGKTAAASAGSPAKAQIPTVRVQTISSEARLIDIVIRGQSEALRKVLVRAETAGKVAAIRADKGKMVKEGDVICELNIDERTAMLKQARAVMKQKQLEADASRHLMEKGFRSETALAGDIAEYEAAKAQAERMENELEHTKLRAPFAGIVDQRLVDVGDYLAPGQACAMVIDQDPFLVVGEVSERSVGTIRVGGPGWAKLVTGERVEGKVRFVSTSSNAATRTFRVELEFANPTGIIRDGVTAEMHITGDEVQAHRISPAILSLDEKGNIGVRIVDETKRVRFAPVSIVSEAADGMWVSGLPKSVRIITVGQDFVTIGQEVNVAEQKVSGL